MDMTIYMNTIRLEYPKTPSGKSEKICYFHKEMDDNIRLMIESMAHTENWDDSFRHYENGVETMFNLHFPVITRQIEFLRNIQGPSETPLKFLERVTLESVTCALDDMTKQTLITLALLNGMSDERVTATVLKDKELEAKGYEITAVRKKIQMIESHLCRGGFY